MFIHPRLGSHPLARRLRLIAPVIKDHGIDYERGKFADKLRSKTLTLERTTAWLHATMAAFPDIARNARDGCRVASLQIHANAVVSLISGDKPVTAETAPETLLFDVPRLETMHNHLATLVAIQATVAVVGTTKNKTLIDAVAAAVKNLEPGAPLDISTLGLPEKVAKYVEAAVRPEDAVSKLLRTKLLILLRGGIVSTSPTACDQICATLVHDIRRLATLNREIHGATYNGIMDAFAAV